MKKNKGFTLIEVLIASSIFIIVMVSIYSAFHTGVFGFRNIENNIEAYQSARKILERLDADLRNSFVYSGEEAKFIGTQDTLTFLTLVDSYLLDSITQDYALVAYKLDGNKLMRLCRRNQDSLNDKSATAFEEMFQGVEISFLYGQKVPNEPMKWKETWGIEDIPLEKQKMPAAVKVKLSFKDKITQDFERTIYLFSAG